MNNIILGNLGQDRRKGNGAKVLVKVFFWAQGRYLPLSKLKTAGLRERRYSRCPKWALLKGQRSPLRAIRGC